MPTPFTTTTLYLLVELNSIGTLSAVDKKDLPAPFTNSMVLTLENCNFIRGKMERPEKTTCQRYDSPKYTSWTYAPPGAITPARAAPITEPEIKTDPTSGHAGDSLGHSSLAPPKPEPAKNNVQVGKLTPEAKEQAPKPKRVAKRTTGYREQQQAMLEIPNPFAMLFNW